MRAPAERRLAAVLLAPALAVLASVTLYPLAQALVLSLERRVPVFGIDEFVGLRHYAFLLRDPAFANALRVTAVFTVASVALEVVLGVAAALALATMRRAFSAAITGVTPPRDALATARLQLEYFLADRWPQ
ncbi:MAG: hypothetical protein AUI04_03420 [Candidatus Rokubacteria bacterium 13_2_20CM_2_64_8]|nr:MAG: hypothetical protein AUI04_03420 [Candidatus Rokubacteria bacterium 13_2_20CM_2_64_8]